MSFCGESWTLLSLDKTLDFDGDDDDNDDDDGEDRLSFKWPYFKGKDTTADFNN